jgi:hypothetical protein
MLKKQTRAAWIFVRFVRFVVKYKAIRMANY